MITEQTAKKFMNERVIISHEINKNEIISTGVIRWVTPIALVILREKKRKSILLKEIISINKFTIGG